MSYKPIEDYGIVGDLHTVALVATDGSIDWCCLPYFDSPSVFAAILDDKKGGYFKISRVGEGVNRQLYHPDTNVLMTYFSSSDSVALLEDFMPLERGYAPRGKGRTDRLSFGECPACAAPPACGSSAFLRSTTRGAPTGSRQHTME